MITAALLLLVPLAAVATEFNIDRDPRLTCESKLAITGPLLNALVELGTIDRIEAEHTAVVPGVLFEGPRRARRDVTVAVMPDGQALVFGPTPRGTVEALAPRSDRTVRVPAFQNVLNKSSANTWSWRRRTVVRLYVGDVPKGEFLDRAEAAVRELMKLNVITRDSLRLGHVYRGTYRMQSLDVLFFPNGPDDEDCVSIFDATTGASVHIEPAVELRQFILLRSGERMGRREGRWVTLPPVGWMDQEHERGSDPGVAEFVAAFPTAFDDLLFRAAIIEGVDFRTSRIVRATDEKNGEEFYLLTARDGEEPKTTYHFMYDPRQRRWINEVEHDTRTFSLPHGERLGLNVGETMYKELSRADEFERTRALFPPR